MRPFLILLAALAFPLIAPAAAHAQVEVNIDQGQRQALPIAAPPFGGADARAQGLGAQIATVMAADLERSGFFRPLPQSAFPEATLDVAATPNLEAWRGAGAQALVAGHAQIDGDGRLRVDFRLWDTASGRPLAGVQFTSTAENWRRLAHKVADNVYKRLTGEDGYFDTRVVFVAESGPKIRRTKRLAVMDQDGANPSFLTTGAEQVLSPRYSGAGQEIAYLALRADSSRLYLFNLETARHESLGDFGGAAYAPGFSPDGEKLAFTLSKGANADIYIMDLRSRATQRLTTTPAIDTSPAFSPDGAKIVFNSDRGGSPQLYVMDAGGGGQHRISFGKGRYTAPVWSPKGDLIAFVRQEGSQFHIGVMRPDGSEERTLTSGYLDEAPTFAPNGRVIMFSHETSGGFPRLWTVDVTGRVQRPVPYTGGAATDPAWSPLLK